MGVSTEARRPWLWEKAWQGRVEVTAPAAGTQAPKFPCAENGAAGGCSTPGRDGGRSVLSRGSRFSLAEPPPHPGQFDVVLCRNVLLYLSAEKRGLAFERLASAMAEDAVLMLGAGETVIGQTKKLAADRSCRGLYRLASDGKADRRETRVA
jgi:hypothetical protein